MKALRIPASKSITNRALILAALGGREILLHNVLEAEDVFLMRAALSGLGVKFEQRSDGALLVSPPKQLEGDHMAHFVGNAGTAARFLSALSLVTTEWYGLYGVERMRERPMEDLFFALRSLGAEIHCLEKENHIPAKFVGRSGKLKTNRVQMSGKVSSQFVSALMLVGTRIPGGLTIELAEEMGSWPYVEMTAELIRIFGGEVELLDDRSQIKVKEGLNPPAEYSIPADMSGGSYSVAYSLLSGKSLTIENWGTDSLQGDESFLTVAEKVGAKIEKKGGELKITPPEKLAPLGTIDWKDMPDVAMTGMILATCAEGESIFRGLESLRVKECDRIRAMEEGLSTLGVEVEVQRDEMRIVGKEKDIPRQAQDDRKVESYDDHRIAMVFGVLREAFNLDYEITNSACVGKTWPEFWLDLSDWAGKLRDVSSVILQREEKYLIVRKPRKNHAWQFPQGGVDAEESLLDAAKRELAEECGTDLKISFATPEPEGEYRYLFPASFSRWKEKKGAKVHFFRATYVSGEVQVDGKEIIEHRWVERSELEEYFDAEYLQKIRALL